MIEVLFEDEDIKISVEYIESVDIYIVHSKVSSWSLSKYKKYLGLFGTALNIMKSRGVEYLYTIPPTDHIEKWQRMFGFEDSGYRPKGWKLMRIKT